MSSALSQQYPRQYPRGAHPQPHLRRGQMPPAAMPDAQRAERDRQEHEANRKRMIQAETERRRAKNPTDKTMPDGVEELIVGDGVQQYKQLRDLERKLDSVMMRKRLDLQDAMHNQTKKYNKLRVWISNTVENQPWQGSGMDENAFDFNMGVEATYKVKIEGRLVEDEDDDDDDDSEKDEEEEEDAANGDRMDQDPQESSKPIQPPQPPKRTKLSHFFKQITVDFDRNKHLQPDGTTQVDWKKPMVPANSPVLPPAADFDCLEFERKGDENINITINVYRDESPERWRLSKELADLVDTDEDDRNSVLMAIWEYIRANGLQQEEEKRSIVKDDKLRAVFPQEPLSFPHIPPALIPHMKPLSPLSLPYTIRVDPEYHSLPAAERYTVYTILIPTNPTNHALAQLLSSAANLYTLRQISNYDTHLALLIQAIGTSKRKQAFLAQMGKDPVGFTKRWIASQRRDLEVLLAEDGRFAADGMGENKGYRGEFGKGGPDSVWGREEVEEAVGVMVQRAGREGRAF